MKAAAVMVLLAASAYAGGIDATITDTMDFRMRLTGLAFKVKAQPGSGLKPATLDHIPLFRGAKRLHLWLAQVDTVAFTPDGKGRLAVKAVLQGEGSTVEIDTPRDVYVAEAALRRRREENACENR